MPTGDTDSPQNTGNKNFLVNDRKANIRPMCKTWENTIKTKCRYYGLPAVRRKHVDEAEANQEHRILPELRTCPFRRKRRLPSRKPYNQKGQAVSNVTNCEATV
jgi:hypothetical protein